MGYGDFVGSFRNGISKWNGVKSLFLTKTVGGENQKIYSVRVETN
jgi:hypothetical protein